MRLANVGKLADHRHTLAALAWQVFFFIHSFILSFFCLSDALGEEHERIELAKDTMKGRSSKSSSARPESEREAASCLMSAVPVSLEQPGAKQQLITQAAIGFHCLLGVLVAAQALVVVPLACSLGLQSMIIVRDKSTMAQIRRTAHDR